MAPVKSEPAYWRTRIFKSKYVYEGREREVRHWSVKLQHAGIRKTIALRAGSRRLAAAEACQAYAQILRTGWEQWLQNGMVSDPGVAEQRSGSLLQEPRRWEEQVLQREHPPCPAANLKGELSVRLRHGSHRAFFPLGTKNIDEAAGAAGRIWQFIEEQGWAAALKRFSSEVTLAFRWCEQPLAWTYTTLCTQVEKLALSDEPSEADGIYVALLESEPGLARVICSCLKAMIGVSRAEIFSTAAQAANALRQ